MFSNIFGKSDFSQEKKNKKGKEMNKFSEWVHDQDKKQNGIARKIGIAPSTLSDILKNGTIPSLRTAYKIEVYSKGAVTLYDWLDQGEHENKKLNKSKIQTQEKTIKK